MKNLLNPIKSQVQAQVLRALGLGTRAGTGLRCRRNPNSKGPQWFKLCTSQGSSLRDREPSSGSRVGDLLPHVPKEGAWLSFQGLFEGVFITGMGRSDLQSLSGVIICTLSSY